MKIASSFNPLSNQFHASREFKKLNAGQKVLTIVITVLAAIVSAPILGLGGVAAFRSMVRKYTFTKIDPMTSVKDPKSGAASVKQGATARKIHRFAARDDGALGLKPKTLKKLYNLDPLVIGKPFSKEPALPKFQAKAELPSEALDSSTVSDDPKEEMSEGDSTPSDDSKGSSYPVNLGQEKNAPASVEVPILEKSLPPSDGSDDPEEGMSEDSATVSSGFEEPCPEPALGKPGPRSGEVEEAEAQPELPLAGKQDASIDYEQLFKELEEANGRLDEIAQMQPKQQKAQGFWSKLWYGEQEEEPEHDLDALTESVEMVIQGHQAFFEADVLPADLPKEAETALAEHKTCLLEASESLMKLKADYAEKGNDQAEKCVAALMDKLDNLLGRLIECEEAAPVEESEQTYLGKLAGVFFETGNPKEIGWKVKKYEAQLKELQQKLNQRFASSLVGGDPGAASLRDLLDALNEFTFEEDESIRFSQNYLAKIRSLYNNTFLGGLREALVKDPDNHYLLDVCEILFTRISLEKECVETIELFDQLGAKTLGQKLGTIDPSSPGTHPFVQRIHTLYHRVHSAPYSVKAPLFNQWGNSARGQWNKNFDPYRQGNPVHVLYRLFIGDKEVKSLGMGTPTIEDSKGSASLSPEFIGFGKAYQKQGKKHLFVLNQNAIPKSGMAAMLVNGDETARCNLILDSQEREDFKGAVYCIGLAKNSPFYSQKGEYSSQDDAALFQLALHRQIFELPREVSGCYIPESIRKEIPELEAKAQGIMESIHTHLFSGKEQLSVNERKLFIEIYYDTLTKYIMHQLGVDSFNISCKDAIDRGAGSNAQLFANCAVALHGELLPEQQKKAEMLMMVRALLVRKRAPIHERVERFAETLDHALSSVDGMQKLHKSVFNKTPIIPM